MKSLPWLLRKAFWGSRQKICVSRQTGFSLIEMMLVISVLMGAAVLEIKRQAVASTEKLAAAAADHAWAVKSATESFIAARYTQISTSGHPQCLPVGSWPCYLSSQALYDDHLLPQGFVENNAWGSGYRIALNKSVDGSGKTLVEASMVTLTPWMDGANPRLDLLGQAVNRLGAWAGYSKTSGVIDGYQGNWTLTATDNNAISGTGQLAVIAKVDSGTEFVRRDGTLPFTGDQSMGGKRLTDINTFIYMGIQTPNTSCPSAGSLGVDTNGLALSCASGVWKSLGAHLWREPVSNFGFLPNSGNQDGDVRLTLDNNRAFAWSAASASWKPLAIDQNGNLDVPENLSAQTLLARMVASIGGDCSAYAAGTLARTSGGDALTCRGGKWNGTAGVSFKDWGGPLPYTARWSTKTCWVCRKAGTPGFGQLFTDSTAFNAACPNDGAGGGGWGWGGGDWRMSNVLSGSCDVGTLQAPADGWVDVQTEAQIAVGNLIFVNGSLISTQVGYAKGGEWSYYKRTFPVRAGQEIMAVAFDPRGQDCWSTDPYSGATTCWSDSYMPYLRGVWFLPR